mmetsp:Transcript_13742/g.28524  ORF Transcript_13742/g.28524 Transcript_13742/m.28524 type:complete len:87 (-) Transcript_13742:182-442(-)
MKCCSDDSPNRSAGPVNSTWITNRTRFAVVGRTDEFFRFMIPCIVGLLILKLEEDKDIDVILWEQKSYCLWKQRLISSIYEDNLSN